MGKLIGFFVAVASPSRCAANKILLALMIELAEALAVHVQIENFIGILLRSAN